MQLQQVKRAVDLARQPDVVDQLRDRADAAVRRGFRALRELVGDVRPSEHRPGDVRANGALQTPLDRGRLGPKSGGSSAAVACSSVSSRSVWPAPHNTRQYDILSGIVVDTADRRRGTRCHRRTPTSNSPTTSSEYRELAAELATIGLIHSGSVTRRYTRCATPGCKCHADPPQPHGPYYQWTAKINGKTVTRRLSETRGGALPGMDRQRPPTTTPHRTDAPDRRQSH